LVRDHLATIEAQDPMTDITLEGLDGASISAYSRSASTASRRGLIVVQEIFGVTAHIRAVVDDYAARGFHALAPRFFDRLEEGVELGCNERGMVRGRDLVGRLGMDAPLRDVRAAADHLLAQGCTTVGVVGYCWGGVVAFLSATRLGLPASSYYGRLVNQFLHERPQAALLFHYGERDDLIPAAAIDAVAARYPGVPLHRYPAGHAFNRLGDPHGDPACAALALERTLAFFDTHLGS
jgi:carboxymethylenebutenolidase